VYIPGLPDGLFSNQKSQIWVNFGIFNDHLEYFMAVWYSLWSFVIFFPLWNVWTKKNLATLVHTWNLQIL
jgi:hypothetical protein